MEANNKFDARDDELLSAMLDGELDDTAADALTERLAREPQLALRLAALRGTDDATRALFARVDEMPMPQAVLDLLAANSANKAPQADNVIPFPRRVVDRFANAPVAIAASVALAAGFFADRLLDDAPDATTSIAALQARSVPQDSAVYDLLENAASAETVTLPDGSTGRVLLTFAAEDGSWCRQLSIENNAAAVAALACRRDGNWRNEVIAFGDPAGGSYQQASAASLAVIGSAVDRLLGDGAMLDATEEQELLKNQWHKKP